MSIISPSPLDDVVFVRTLCDSVVSWRVTAAFWSFVAGPALVGGILFAPAVSFDSSYRSSPFFGGLATGNSRGVGVGWAQMTAALISCLVAPANEWDGKVQRIHPPPMDCRMERMKNRGATLPLPLPVATTTSMDEE
jgi:hypothetical protein